ncbi:MAG TPA: hypothetical protein VI895_03670 [Bdellovibrionota bacterium]|nr:hypothetical protein [Bdellovibrionota bacterium]
MVKGKILIFLCVSSVSLMLRLSPAGATLTLPMNIEEITDGAESIVLGTVVSVTTEKAAFHKLPASVARIHVEERLKGPSGKDVVVRQLAIQTSSGNVMPIGTLPHFRLGERVVVFLPAKSSIGFASPVGFGQGVFRMISKPGNLDKSLLRNEFGNRGLFDRLQDKKTAEFAAKISARITSKQPVRLAWSDLRQLVELHRGVSP